MAGWNEWVPGTNMTLSEVLDALKSASIGLDVKDKLYWSFFKVVQEAIKEGNANFDVEMAKGVYNTLKDRLDAGEVKLEDTNSQISRKITKGSGQIEWADISPSVREDMTDGKVAIVGDKSVGTPQLINNSVTPEILNFPTNKASAPSSNLFNKDSAIIGKYVASVDGSIASNAAYSYNVISVVPDEKLTIKIAEQVVFKNISGVYISGQQYFDTQQTITVPAGAATIWLNTPVAKLEEQQINRGVALLKYENYFPKVAEVDLSDGAVSPDKTDFFETSTNLYNPNTVTLGKYIAANDGSVGTAVAYSHSDYIKVVGGEEYTIRFKEQIAFYTSEYLFISGINNSVGTPNGVFTFTVPANANYMIVNTMVIYIDKQQVNLGDRLSSYESYDKKIPERMIRYTSPSRQILETIGSTIAVGEVKRIKLLGDSITHGVGGTGWNQNGSSIGNTAFNMSPNSVSWGNMLRDYLSEKFGSTVINWGATGTDTQWILNNITSLVQEADDLIILMIGTNDRILGKGDLASYRSRLTEIVDYIHSRGKKVILMSSAPATIDNETSPQREFHMEDVDTAIMTVASKFNMEYISLFKCILEYCDYKTIDFSALLSDGLHPNDDGYEVMYKFILKSLGLALKVEGATW